MTTNVDKWLDENTTKIRANSKELFPTSFELSLTQAIRHVSRCETGTVALIYSYYLSHKLSKELLVSPDLIEPLYFESRLNEEDQLALKYFKQKNLLDWRSKFALYFHGNLIQETCFLDKLATSFNIKYFRASTDLEIKTGLIKYGLCYAKIPYYYDFKTINNVIDFNVNSDICCHTVAIYGWNEIGWLCTDPQGIKATKQEFILPYNFLEVSQKFNLQQYNLFFNFQDE